MLKLEKNLEEIEITFREKEKFFNSLFLKALGAAAAFHIIFFLVFQIQPFKMISSFSFPPVKVHTELASEAVIQLEEEEKIAMLPPPPYSIMQPKKELPQIPTTPKTPSIPPVSTPSILLASKPTQRVEVPEVQIFVSGDLANREWSEPEKKIQVPIGTDPLFVKYKVQADENTGEIFWFELVQDSGSDKVNHYTEQILLGLHFATDGYSLNDLTGTIDFVIYSEEQS
jgi:hypothetical protein